MKKLIILSSLLFAIASQAAILTVTNGLATTATATLPTLLGNGAAFSVQYILLTSVDTNVAVAGLYDVDYATNISYVTAAYTSVTRYATNYINTWTNYYGATNSWTNTVMQSVYVTNAASTNLLLPKYLLRSPAGTTTEFELLNGKFGRGLVVTNAGAGTLNITVGYTQ